MVGVDVYNACKGNNVKSLIELIERSQKEEFELPFDFIPESDLEDYEVRERID